MLRAFRAAANKVKTIASMTKSVEALSSNAPSYMQVSPDDLVAVYGSDIAERVFSDEFTEARWSAIEQTVPESDELGWGMYDIYPAEHDSGDIIWIERYIIKGARESQRGLLMILKDNALHVVHLVPGETLTSPQLQCDTMALVLPLALEEGGAEGGGDIRFDTSLVRNGIPDVWPQGCHATLVDTVLIERPDGQQQNWTERWGFQVGGEAVIIDIAFVALGDGGTQITPTVRRDS